jgi:putative transposase
LSKNPQPWSDQTESEYHRLFTLKIETWLDQGKGECLLQNQKIREIVLTKILENHSITHIVHSLVIMPNHLHVLVSITTTTLPKLMHHWKGATSYLINKHLNRKTTFWQRDYFDRIIRDARHCQRCKRYIANNPQKAHLNKNQYTLYGE